LTATTAENALFLEVMAGEDGYDPRQHGIKLERYTKAIEQGIKGLRIGLVKEGFGQHDSHPDVDAGVRDAAKVLEKLGAKVSEISIPWHLTGLGIWAAIGLEGTYHVLYGSAGLGRHVEGVYSLAIGARLASLRERAHELADTVTVGMLLGSYTAKYYKGFFYFKAQNLRRRLRAEYDKALAAHDILLMPTTRMMASKHPAPSAPLQDLMQHSWEQIGNTCPFNVTHHPSISIPCGFGEGDRPIGLMLTAKHWQESLLYRVANAFERSCDWQMMGPKGLSRRTKRKK
jgi:amidase